MGKWKYSSINPSTSVLDGSDWSASFPCRFTAGEAAPYPLDRSMGAPQSRPWTLRNKSKLSLCLAN
jgi:hypothetical protein